MRRWWIVLALLLSLGINIGILATLATRRIAVVEEPAGPLPEPYPETRPLPPPEVRPLPPAPEDTPPEELPAKPAPEPAERRERQPPPPPPPPRAESSPPFPVLRLADHLGLEGETRRRFLQRQRRFHQEAQEIRFQLGEVQRELRREIAAPEPDRQRLDALVREAADHYLLLERALVSNVIDSRVLLTPEQEREFLKILPRLRPRDPGAGGPPPGMVPRQGGPRRDPRDRFPDDRRPRRRRPPRGAGPADEIF